MIDCIYFKKNFFFLKNTGQLDPTRNPTHPMTRLTRSPIDQFKNDPFWPATRLTRPDPTRTRPYPTRPFCHVYFSITYILMNGAPVVWSECLADFKNLSRVSSEQYVGSATWLQLLHQLIFISTWIIHA